MTEPTTPAAAFNPTTLPASAGWAWIVLGWRLYRKSPLIWLLLVMVFWLSLTVVAIVPILGALAATALLPALSVGFLLAGDLIERNQPCPPTVLFTALKANPRGFLTLGLAYLAGMLIVLGASSLADGGAFFRMMMFGQIPAKEVIKSDSFFVAINLWFMLYVPYVAAFWFAPALVHYAKMEPLKAVFYSFFASLRNMRAFFIYAMAWALIAFVLGAVIMLLASSLSQAPLKLARGMMLPLGLMMMSVLYCTFYASYRTVFQNKPSPPPAEPPAP